MADYKVDYSVYLVTDSTMIPKSSTLEKQVEDSIAGGATLVQLREKSLSTLDFIKRAESIHKLTKKAGIPLIINDRIDVALAIDAEGIHIGQDDMPLEIARRIMGPSKIIGLTCSNVKETTEACKQGFADYLGIGTVYQTNTKKDVKDPSGTGPIGVRQMLRVVEEYNSTRDKKLRVVAIGGINHSNAAKVMSQCCYNNQRLDGLAIVSCIMAAEDAKKATQDFKKAMDTPTPWYKRDSVYDIEHDIIEDESYADSVALKQPLIHHITNNVVKNFSANVTLAIGASPIMSELADEFEEFASTNTHLSLLINLGTPINETIELFKHAIYTYNKYGKPIVFDPVAAGATTARLEACRQILNAGHVTVIKGNVGEIMAIWKLTAESNKLALSSQIDVMETTTMRGVDSVAAYSEDIINNAKTISREFKCIVVVTGEYNLVVDWCVGKAVTILGGDKLMGKITGTGCSLGSVIAAYISEQDLNPMAQFNKVVAAVRNYNKAGEMAAYLAQQEAFSSTVVVSDFKSKYQSNTDSAQVWTLKDGVRTGNFMIKFLDCLSHLHSKSV